MATALGDDFDVWGLDVRGHGRSAVEEGWTIDWNGFATDVLAAAASVTLDRAVVGFGHSMGATALLLAAVADPRRFQRLVLFEPIVIPPDADTAPSHHLAELTRRRRSSFASVAEARANFASKPPMDRFHADALDGYLAAGLTTADDGTVELSCRPDYEADVYLGAIGSGAWEAAPTITTPTVVITGPDSSGPPAALAPLLAERLPHGELVVIERFDHFAPFNQPADFATTVAAAL